MPITERTKRLKDRCRWKHFMGGDFIDPNTKVGVERMRHFTESYRETMGEPEVIRRAKALDKLLRNMTMVIQEDELLVGDHAEHPDWVPLWPELGHFQFLDFIDSEYFPEGHEEEVEECYKFWENIGQQKKGEAFCTPQELNGPYQFNPVEPPTFTGASTSMTPPYESVLEDGLEKRIEEAQKKVDDAMRELSTPPWISKEKLKYLPLIDEWKAMVIAGKAVIAWARRYSRLAKVIAERFEKDQKRKAELMEISDICWRVPAQPAKGLRDAMQAKWFTYVVCASLETYASGYGQKEDRLLWPYYKTSVIDKTFQQGETEVKRGENMKLLKSPMFYILGLVVVMIVVGYHLKHKTVEEQEGNVIKEVKKQFPNHPYDLYGACSVGQGRYFVVGSNGVILRSKDMGKTWNECSLDQPGKIYWPWLIILLPIKMLVKNLMGSRDKIKIQIDTVNN